MAEAVKKNKQKTAARNWASGKFETKDPKVNPAYDSVFYNPIVSVDIASGIVRVNRINQLWGKV